MFSKTQIIWVIRLLICFIATPVYAEDASVPDANLGLNEDEPVVLVADAIGYDTENRKVIAKGNVEISQNLTVLMAQQVEYEEDTEIVTARDDVVVMESTGNVYFADEVVLTDEMKRGTITYFKGRLADGSIFTARDGEKVSDTVTKLRKAVYTPCSLFCPDGTPKRPTWAVTASNVSIDTEEQEVSYDNVWVEFYGQKMLYTPMFSHPTPGADNKSGFLSPMLRRNENLGVIAEVPYYYVIDQSEDITISPMFTSKEGPVFQGEYRKRFDRGDVTISGSFTVPEDRDSSGALDEGRTYRGHIDSDGIYTIDNAWQTGFTLRRATDDTYLARYNILPNESLLTSRAYVEGINPLNNGNERHYFLTHGLYFQGLTAQDDQARTPVVLPLVEYGYTTEPMIYNSRITIDGSLMALSRDTGADSQRITTRVNWNVPYVTDSGHLFSMDSSLRADGYYVDNQLLSGGGEFNGTKTRIIPQIAATWRYPLLKQLESSNLVIEPTANITASPIGLNDAEIPNEDTVLPEFNDLNLFSSNRFSGWDQVEEGIRAFYGIRSMWDFFENRYLATTLGQVYQSHRESPFPLTSDLRSHVSDYVGRFLLAYKPLQVSYRFRLDQDSFQTRRNEVETLLHFYRTGISLNYLELNEDPFLGDNKEIYGSSYLRLNDYWTLSANARRDLELQRMTNAGLGLQFANECTTLILGANRDLTSDRDIRSSTTFYMQLLLKNLD